MAKRKPVPMMSPDQRAELIAGWKTLCAENFARMGDYGSCVLGAGLKSSYGGPLEISTHDVTNVQGCCVWEAGLQKLLDAFNAKHGTAVWYACGNMD